MSQSLIQLTENQEKKNENDKRDHSQVRDQKTVRLDLEMRGIEPRASRMQSERSTI
jgi:hypothetical protein